MIPAPFRYARAASVGQALSVLADDPEAKLLAGGQSLIPLAKLRLAQAECLVDIGKLRELAYVREESGHIAIGALTRHAELVGDAVARRAVPLLSHVAGYVGDPQVRRWGTIGGSLCHADPAADLCAAALALDAELLVRGPDGDRTIAIDDWFKGFWGTALEPGEMLIEVRVRPTGPAVGWEFVKFTRRAIDWATVGVAVVSREGGHRVALMNMGNRPLRAEAVEAELQAGTPWNEAAALAAEGTEPPSDVLANAGYRRALAAVLVRRALAGAQKARS